MTHARKGLLGNIIDVYGFIVQDFTICTFCLTEGINVMFKFLPYILLHGDTVCPHWTWSICPKPNSFYDSCLRPTAWARVKIVKWQYQPFCQWIVPSFTSCLVCSCSKKDWMLLHVACYLLRPKCTVSGWICLIEITNLELFKAFQKYFRDVLTLFSWMKTSLLDNVYGARCSNLFIDYTHITLCLQ